jgi:hypothetical protein
LIIPIVDVLHRVSLRIVTMPIQSQGIITRDNVSVDVSAVAYPLALQLRNLQSLVEIGVDKNTTVVFPAPLMSTIGELGTFLAREAAAANSRPAAAPVVAVPMQAPVVHVPSGNGTPPVPSAN